MSHEPNYWLAYECFGCKSLTDVRVPPTHLDEENPGSAVKNCPVCGEAFRSQDFRTFWPEDEGGFGSRGDGGLIPDEALDELRRTNLAAAAERMADNLEGHVSLLGGVHVPSDSEILRQIVGVLRGKHKHEAHVDTTAKPFVGWEDRNTFLFQAPTGLVERLTGPRAAILATLNKLLPAWHEVAVTHGAHTFAASIRKEAEAIGIQVAP